MRFRVCLAALRDLRGLTQEALAVRGGLGRGEVCKMERGTNKATSARSQDALARAFGVPVKVVRELVAGTLSQADMALAFGASPVDLRRALATARERLGADAEAEARP